MKKLLFVLMATLLGQAAMADQCAYNGRALSQAARAVLVNHSFIYQFCELCGDESAKEYPIYSDKEKTQDGKAIHFRDRGDNGQGSRYWEFSINEGRKDGSAATLDLAYTYIKLGDHLVNVGAIFSCLKDGVKASAPDATPVVNFVPEKVDCSATGACG